jgi:hypothetical protein
LFIFGLHLKKDCPDGQSLDAGMGMFLRFDRRTAGLPIYMRMQKESAAKDLW